MMRNAFNVLIILLLACYCFPACGVCWARSTTKSRVVQIKITNFNQFSQAHLEEGCECLIRGPVDLNGKKITLPPGVQLSFTKKGAIINGILLGDKTRIQSKYNSILGVKIQGTWVVEEISDLMFMREYLTDTDIINNLNTIQSDSVSNELTISQNYVFDIPKSGGAGLKLSSNSTLLLNGSLSITPNDFKSYSIIDVNRKYNVCIKGGSVVGDVGKHNYVEGSTSEWGKGVNIMESQNVVIEDLYISLCTGDGIYVSGGYESAIGNYDHSSRNITIKGVICDDNRRQGISIIHVDGLIVRDCSFINTGRTESTAPSAGIDIEPNVTNNRNMSVRNVVIENCIIKNNKGMAIANSTTYEQDGYVTHEKILYSNCSSDGLLKCSADGVSFYNCSFKEARLASVYTPTRILFDNCTISGGYGIIIFTPPTPNTHYKNKLLALSFKGCNISTISDDTETSSLISCNRLSVSNIESITFENCRLEIPRSKRQSYSLTNSFFSDKLHIISSEIIMPGRVLEAKGIILDGNIIRCQRVQKMPISSTNLLISE